MKFTSASGRLRGRLLFFCFSVVSISALAAEEEMPSLRPPHGELRPSFWEQNGWRVALAAALALAAAAFWIHWLRRPKPAVVLSPGTLARRDLEFLRGRPEDAALVVEVSRIIRHYVISALNLPPDELTTAEIRQALQTHPQPDAALFAEITNFLSQSDERKFAPVPPAAPMSAVTIALVLIEKVENRALPPNPQSPIPNPQSLP